jgi:hypothetical protein
MFAIPLSTAKSFEAVFPGYSLWPVMHHRDEQDSIDREA